MKGLGLAGAGLGAAAAAAPVFHDLDELASAPTATKHLPWYVKERELLNPTTEIDWDILQRTDNRYCVQGDLARSHYPSYARYAEVSAIGKAVRARRYANQEPGYDLKWQALSNGRSARTSGASTGFAGLRDEDDWSDTPAEMGLPNWTGTPEEASRLVMAAIRYFGATLVGFAELDSTWRNKLVWKYSDRPGRERLAGETLRDEESSMFVYEDVPRAYEKTLPQGGRKYVIPTKRVSLIDYGTPQTPEMRKTMSIRSNTNSTIPSTYTSDVRTRLARFLRSLGDYQLFGQSGHQSATVTAAVAQCMTGIGELSRQNNYALSLELGPNYNPKSGLLTDLVLAPTKPIDAGMWRFCHSCAICAKQCPSGSLSTEKEPTWEIPLTDGLPTVYKHVGPKMFWMNMISCRMYIKEFDGCYPEGVGADDKGGGRACFAVCPFGEDRAAAIHNVIRATTATTGLFNSFFANMADVFGVGNYGEDPDLWWDMSLPAFGIPTHIRATKGQWKMK